MLALLVAVVYAGLTWRYSDDPALAAFVVLTSVGAVLSVFDVWIHRLPDARAARLPVRRVMLAVAAVVGAANGLGERIAAPGAAMRGRRWRR